MCDLVVQPYRKPRLVPAEAVILGLHAGGLWAVMPKESGSALIAAWALVSRQLTRLPRHPVRSFPC